MLAFDATSREVCTARRERTATPLQALVLLNDPQFIEAARGLAERLLRLPLEDRDARLCSGFRHLTSRNPTVKELDVLSRLYEEQKQHFETIPNDATAFLAIGESPRQESFVPSELAAMTVVMHTVMSYDECVTKR